MSKKGAYPAPPGITSATDGPSLLISPCLLSFVLASVPMSFIPQQCLLFCSWTAVAGSFGCHFGGFFSCSATLLSKISTPLETCVGQKLILIQMRPTCYSPVLSFMYIFFIIACRNMRGHSPASANCTAPAGSRTQGTSMGGLYVAATLQALLFMRYFWICLFYFLF